MLTFFGIFNRNDNLKVIYLQNHILHNTPALCDHPQAPLMHKTLLNNISDRYGCFRGEWVGLQYDTSVSKFSQFPSAAAFCQHET